MGDGFERGRGGKKIGAEHQLSCFIQFLGLFSKEKKRLGTRYGWLMLPYVLVTT